MSEEAVMTWDEFERRTPSRRPRDWETLPDGPDQAYMIAYDATAAGFMLSRREVLHALGGTAGRMTETIRLSITNPSPETGV